MKGFLILHKEEVYPIYRCDGVPSLNFIYIFIILSPITCISQRHRLDGLDSPNVEASWGSAHSAIPNPTPQSMWLWQNGKASKSNSAWRIDHYDHCWVKIHWNADLNWSWVLKCYWLESVQRSIQFLMTLSGGQMAPLKLRSAQSTSWGMLRDQLARAWCSLLRRAGSKCSNRSKQQLPIFHGVPWKLRGALTHTSLYYLKYFVCLLGWLFGWLLGCSCTW